MSELALELIAENKRTKAKFLDLGNCGLRAVPEEIADLEWLEGLSFASEWWEWEGDKWQQTTSGNRGEPNDKLADIRGLSRVASVQQLYLNWTKVTDVDAIRSLASLQCLSLSYTKVCDVGPLRGLAALKTLDLRGTEVSNVGSLASLASLQTLVLSSTRLSNVGPLAGLSSLRTLDLSNTPVSDVGPLASLASLQGLSLGHTQVIDINPLKGLVSLKTLSLSDTSVRDVGPLGYLGSLQSLNLSSTNVTNISPLHGLGCLETLYLSSTPLEDISPLKGLTCLRTLSLSCTQVSNVTPVEHLASLQTLRLGYTNVSDISSLTLLLRKGLLVHCGDPCQRGSGIYLAGCRLTTPPLEIVEQGNTAILNYFDQLKRGPADRLYEAKMLLLGEGGAGKTSLLRRLYQADKGLPGADESTKGIEIFRHEFPLANGRTFRLNVWDFGGQEIYHATHHFFLTRRSLYILVDDTKKDYKSATDDGFKYWLELVEVFGDKSPVLIFQNEKSGRSKAIDLLGIKARFENVKDKYEGNLEHGWGADKLRRAIEHFVQDLPHIGDNLPGAWVKVREEIEARAAQAPYIPRQEYFDIYARHLNEFDETQALHLSRYLHDLGVFLHFQDDPLLADTVILQNEWATAAVFRMLDAETVKARLGRFTMEDCRQLWPEASYQRKHAHLVALMERFELCYPMRDSNPATWLATQLLPPSKPASLQDWGKAGDLVLRYRYDFLPKGMISRLTVRLHRYVQDPEKAWRTGVMFERDDTTVLVELLQSGNEIELRGRGLERKDLLCVVAADLDALNDSFQGLRDKVQKQIPCNCTVCSQAKVPQFYAQRYLLKRKQDGKVRMECPASYADVDVVELLDGVRVSARDEMRPRMAPAALRMVRIFLASSAELRGDRDEFERYFLSRNKMLVDDGVLIEVVRWEEFLDAVSATRLQDEYNRAIRKCDICLCLFATKVGKYTEEEFDVAYGQFKATGRPRVWTYFKDVELKMSGVRKDDMRSVWAFQERLDTLGHFHTQYSDIEHLKRQFRDQLEMWLKGGGMAAGSGA